MPQRNVDDRSKKIVFVSNCLLNANNKVQEFARYPGMFTEVVRTLDKYGVGVMQMPCPEVLHIGCQRWWHSRNLYDNAGFRHFCRTLAEQMVELGMIDHVPDIEAMFDLSFLENAKAAME